MSDDTPRSRLGLDWSNTLAGALAAVSSAVLLSTLGAAGTLIGAAVGSIAATIGTALYSQGLAKSKEKVAKAQEAALNKVGIAQADVRRARRRGAGPATAATNLEHAEEQLAEAEADLGEAFDDGRDHSDDNEDEVLEGFPEDDVKPAWRERLAVLPWKRIAIYAAAAFAVALITIAAFELISGRSVSSYTGGSDRDSSSTFRRRRRRQQTGPGPKQKPEPDPSDSTTPSDEPTDEPTESPAKHSPSPRRRVQARPRRRSPPTRSPRHRRCRPPHRAGGVVGCRWRRGCKHSDHGQ